MPRDVKCAYPGCNRMTPKPYMMGWEDDEGRVKFGLVCATHDKILGRTNLAKLLDLTKSEAIDLDLEIDKEVKAERQQTSAN